MARRKDTPTPIDELQEIRGRRVGLARQRDDWATKRGEAERKLNELPDRRREAMAAEARGESAELPSGGELHALVAECKERDAAIRKVERDLTEEEHAGIDAHLSFFDAQAEAASREAEAELATAIEAAKVAQAAIRTAAGEWSRVRIARIRQHRTPMQEMLAPDFEGPVRELEKAKANIWPGMSEIRWQEFQQREATPPDPPLKREARARPHFEVM